VRREDKIVSSIVNTPNAAAVYRSALFRPSVAARDTLRLTTAKMPAEDGGTTDLHHKVDMPRAHTQRVMCVTMYLA